MFMQQSTEYQFVAKTTVEKQEEFICNERSLVRKFNYIMKTKLVLICLFNRTGARKKVSKIF